MIRGWRYISTLLMAVVMLLSPLNVVGAGAALTPQGGTYVYDATSLPYDAPSDGAPRTLGELAGAWTNDDGTTGAVGLATGSNQISVWWPRSFVAPTSAADDVGSAFHHTADEFVDSIMDTGLRPGSYATPVEGLSPLQAHIDLALNQAGGARNSVLTVDLAGLRAAMTSVG